MSGDQKVFGVGSQSVIELVRADVPEGHLMDYVQRNRALYELVKELAPNVKGSFWATFVGPNRSNILAMMEHPSLAAYAENIAKIEGNPDVRKIGAEVASCGRVVLESSLMLDFPMG